MNSSALGTLNAGRPLRRRLTLAATLAALSLAVAVTPGVRSRLISALSNASGGASPAGAVFSDPPTDDEILRATLFAQPLIPVGPSSPDENRQVGTLLVTYSKALIKGQTDAVQPLADYAARHPGSVWTPGLLLDLGEVYRKTGHFSKALATWQSAWDASKNLTTPNGQLVGDAAAGQLSQFEAYLGRKELLEPLLAEIKTRPVRGTAEELISESSRGLAEMKATPEISFKCGPMALARILRTTPTSDVTASRRVLNDAPSTSNGLSLTAVQAMSVDAGMNYQMAYRSPGAALITPAVAHWKVGHYAAVLGKGDRIFVGDATFGEDIELTPSTFDEETSGYFLVPPGPLPPGWRRVDVDEGGSVWGRGNTGKNHDPGATGRQEIQSFDCKPNSGVDPGGCTRWNVEAAVIGLELRDDPIGYAPPVGPEIRFPMTYSHRDVQQVLPFTFTNFGNKWTFDWLSYVIDGKDNFTSGHAVVMNPAASGRGVASAITFSGPARPFCADLYRRGGGEEPYVFPGTLETVSPTTTVSSAEGQFSQGILTRKVDPSTGFATSFVRTLPDGSVETFAFAPGTPGTMRKFFMTEFDDPQGVAVHINYDLKTSRIMSIVDATGKSTTICYNDATAPTPCTAPAAAFNPPSSLQVTEIIDPFGRFATFQYDPATGHLTGITDVLGITSQYHYNGATSSPPEDPDFVTSMTTPYGTTTFQYSDSTNTLNVVNSRSLKATEVSSIGPSESRTSYVEFTQGGFTCPGYPGVSGYPDPAGTFAIGAGSTFDNNWIECTDGDVTSHATPEPVNNNNLQFRNTYTWNPKQYATSFPNGVAQANQYLGSKIIHWLHTDNDDNQTSLTASRIPESTKEPLEKRVWYLYPAQNLNAFTNDPNVLNMVGVGGTNQPTAIIQAIGDGTYKNWQYVYDGYGHVTQSIDPVGRTLTMAYDGTNNDIDLLSVTNTTPAAGTAKAHNDLLLSLSNYVHHKPQTVIAANGQKTQFTYNDSGQLQTTTDPLNNTWTYTHAPATGGSLTRIVGPTVTPPGGAPQTPTYAFTYDSVGRLWTAEGPDGQLHTFSYDSADRLTETLFPDTTKELRGYAYLGNPLLDLTSFTDRQGNVTTRAYNGFRDLIEIDEPSARTTKLTYFPDGSVQTVQDPLHQTTTYTRDVEGRAMTVTLLDNATEQYLYDSVGRLASKSPDATLTQPGTVRYAYYVDDAIKTQLIDARAPTNFFYDPAYPRRIEWSRVRGGTWANPNCGGCAPMDGEIYSYNPVGGLGANKLAHVQTLIATSWPTVSSSLDTSYSYDALNRTSLSSILNTVGGATKTNTGGGDSFQYDALGRLTSDSNILDYFTYTYKDATNRVTGRTSSTGPQIAASYFPPLQDGLLQQLTYTSRAGVTLAGYGYTYDARHNVRSFSDSATGSSTYNYDAYNQLATGSLPGSEALTVTPSIVGNLSSLQTVAPNGTSSLSFLYDSSNKMMQKTTSEIAGVTTSSTEPVTSNATTGSLTLTGTSASYDHGYNYDQSNRVSFSANVGRSTSSYLYDGLGRLSEVIENTWVWSFSPIADHSYAWCGQKICMEFDNTQTQAFSPPSGWTGSTSTLSGTPDATYVAQGTITNSNMTSGYDITDLLGSERAFVSIYATPTILAQYDYDTFGNPSILSGNAALSNRGFAGMFYDAPSGLHFARNRAYDSNLGRWLTRDPIGMGHAFDDPARFNATDLNLYAYAGNNPQSMVDPSGNDAIGIGFNLGSAFGAGTAFSGGHSTLGGYLELGFVYNTETGQLDLYGSIASTDGLPGYGFESALGVSVTDTPEAADFYGYGYEVSGDAWWDGAYGANLQQEFDEDWNRIGTAGGASLGPGGGAFAYHTYTAPIWTIFRGKRQCSN